jgi:hypothetical protein
MTMGLKEKVEKLAYELYEKNGRHAGRELLDWLAAEQIVRFQQMIFSGMGEDQAGLLEYKPLYAAEPASVPPVISKTRPRRSTGNRRKMVARSERRE